MARHDSPFRFLPCPVFFRGHFFARFGVYQAAPNTHLCRGRFGESACRATWKEGAVSPNTVIPACENRQTGATQDRGTEGETRLDTSLVVKKSSVFNALKTPSGKAFGEKEDLRCFKGH